MEQHGEELGPYWEQTIRLYSQLLERPSFTPELLSKPPFRFLHDVFVATMERTGWGQGLLQGGELDPEYYRDSLEKQQDFLTKVIGLTEGMLGQKIDVSIRSICAGAEAHKTNLWLQQMYLAATSGVNSMPYVGQIL